MMMSLQTPDAKGCVRPRQSLSSYHQASACANKPQQYLRGWVRAFFAALGPCLLVPEIGATTTTITQTAGVWCCLGHPAYLSTGAIRRRQNIADVSTTFPFPPPSKCHAPPLQRRTPSDNSLLLPRGGGAKMIVRVDAPFPRRPCQVSTIVNRDAPSFVSPLRNKQGEKRSTRSP